MTSTTFIHTSDLQIGMERGFLGSDGQARFNAARLASIDKLGELAAQVGADFIVVAGDVFEHNSLSPQTTGRAREALAHLDVPVYLLPGNHDPLVADSIFFRTQAEGIHVIGDSEPIPVADGVELVGAPYLSKRSNHDLVAAALQPLEPIDTIRVAVGHGQVESRTSEDDAELIDLSLVEDKIRAGAIDYLALGDTHSAMPLGSTGAVWFSGAPETTAFHEVETDAGENNSGKALAVTIEKTSAGNASVTVEQHQLGEWRFEALSAELTTSQDVDHFIEKLKAYPHKDRTVIKYGLQGTLGIQDTQRLQHELEALEPVFADLRERGRTMDLHLAPSEDELADLDLSGYAAGALEEIIADMDADPVARDAANLLFRLSSPGARKGAK